LSQIRRESLFDCGRSAGQKACNELAVDPRCVEGGLVSEGRIVVHNEALHADLARRQVGSAERRNTLAKVNDLL
jgi:hypothetical protein